MYDRTGDINLAGVHMLADGRFRFEIDRDYGGEVLRDYLR